MRRGIGRLRAGGSSLDSSAAAWAAAVTASGGTYSGATLAAVSNFAKSAKANGYFNKLLRVNLFCGDQLAAALVPLVGNTGDTNINFVAGDYSEATGLTGNGTTKYLRTGFVPSASGLALNSTHLGVYNRAGAAAGGSVHLGARDGTNFLEILAPNTDGNFYSRAYDVNTVSGAVAVPFGHLVGSRTASNSHTIYKGGSQVATSGVAAAGALVALEMYVFATNSSGTPNFFSSHPLGAYHIGSGLTQADVTAFNTDMVAFQTALGRNV